MTEAPSAPSARRQVAGRGSVPEAAGATGEGGPGETGAPGELRSGRPGEGGDPDGTGPPGTPRASSGRRGEQTRALILDTALRLFREQGYDATTMRAIAREAGVSVGNAYYYFDSKEHLIQCYYDDIGRQHRARARPALDGVTDLATRLRTALRTHLDVVAPYHTFAGGFFKTAADPTSPLSPFSGESAPARQEATTFFADVVAGSDAKIAKRLREELPNLLWLYHMGVILYWVHDDSEGATRTYELVDRTVPLVVRLIGLARVPLLRGLLDDVLDLVRSLTGGDRGSPGS